MALSAQYSHQLERFIGSSKILRLYWKGRVALYALLKSIGVGPGDEVILPAYTCIVVPNAILYTGATPIYVDINPDTFCCDSEDIQAAITPNTKAIICQNTYGLSWQVDKIAALGKQHGILTIEDCTHGFGGTYQGQANGSFCDASFFSSQWNKPFSTGLGGYLQLNREALVVGIDEMTVDLPSYKQQLELACQLAVKRWLLNDRTYWLMRKIYRVLSRFNIVTGSSQGYELTRVTMAPHFLQSMGPVQIKEGMRALKSFPKLHANRRVHALQIHACLKEMKKTTVPDSVLSDHGFLLYPVRTSDRAAFFAEAEKSKIRIIDWFTSPLHPVQGDLSAWKFDRTQYPNTAYLAEVTCGIPVHDDVQKVIDFLGRTGNFLI